MKTPFGTVAIAKNKLLTSPARRSLVAAGFLMLGILLADHYPTTPFLLAGAAMVMGVMLIIITVIYARPSFVSGLFLIGMAMVFAAAGMLAHGITRPPSPPEFTAIKQINIQGEVLMTEVMTNGRQRIRLRPHGNPHDGYDYRLITAAKSPALMPGDVITASARLQPPLRQLLPGGFDFTRHAHRQDFIATGFIKNIKRIEKRAPSYVHYLRYSVQARLYAHLDPDVAAVASALLVGLRGGITRDIREDFRGSGLAHLLAISGLHMALFWGSVVAVIRLVVACFPHLASRFSSLKIATICAGPFGLGYLILSGMPISAVRAFLMLALVMVAILMTRRGFTLHHVALVAMGILIFNPESLYHPAFQMSFAAVFALVAGWVMVHRSGLAGTKQHFLIRYFLGIISASLLASAASAPFVLHHFGLTTLWSLFANIVGMPLMGFMIIPVGAAALLLMPLGLEALPLAVMGAGIEALVFSAGKFADLPYARLAIKPPSGTVLVFIALAMISAALPLTGHLLRRFSIPLAASIIALVVWVTTPMPVAVVTALHGRQVAAVKGADNSLYFSRKKIDPFTQSILRRPFGVAEGKYIGSVKCPNCGRGWVRLEATDGLVVGLVYRKFALTQACRESDLVLSMATAAYPCASGAKLVDKAQIEDAGGAMIFYDEGKLTVMQVHEP